MGFAGFFIAGDVLIVVRGVRLRHEFVDLASDNLARAIAEDSFRCGIEQHNATAPVDGNHCVLRRIDKTFPPGRVAPEFLRGAVVVNNLGQHVGHCL